MAEKEIAYCIPVYAQREKGIIRTERDTHLSIHCMYAHITYPICLYTDVYKDSHTNAHTQCLDQIIYQIQRAERGRSRHSNANSELKEIQGRVKSVLVLSFNHASPYQRQCVSPAMVNTQ